MSTEQIWERLTASYQVLSGKAEAVSQEELTRLRNMTGQNETGRRHEERLKWMEKPFLLLWKREDGQKITFGRQVDPRSHIYFSPAVKIEVKSEKLVGHNLPLEFLLNSDSLPKVASLQANHTLKLGPNVIMPGIAIKTNNLAEDDYSVSIATFSGLILDSFQFRVGQSTTPARLGVDGMPGEYDEIINTGITLQDVIDLIENSQV